MLLFHEFAEHLGDVGRAILAVVVGVLPVRYWDRFESLAVARLAVPSSLLTLLAGLLLGVQGLLAYLRRASDALANGALDLAARQVGGAAPPLDFTTFDLQTLSIFSVAGFVLFTPLGLFTSYVALSGLARTVSAAVGQPLGDPLLTALDGCVRRIGSRWSVRKAEASRRRAEGPEVPDRLYPGEWAGLRDVDYVLVCSRRKPDWTCGTFVITADKWYTLGEPVDRQLPQGLRTFYPLTEQKVPEVLRRGVAYELPPLMPTRQSRGTSREV